MLSLKTIDDLWNTLRDNQRLQILQQQSAAGGGPTREVLRRLAAGLRGDVFASSRQEDEAAAVPALKAMDLDWTERQIWDDAFANLEMVREKRIKSKKRR